MLHWTIICGLMVYCCSSIILISACWGLYIYWHIPWWIVFMIFLGSFSAVILIPLCWFFFFWSFKDTKEEEPKGIPHLAIYVEPPSGKVQSNVEPPVYYQIERIDNTIEK